MFRRTNVAQDAEALNARLLRLPAIQQALKQEEAENEATRKKLAADLAKLARESEREARGLAAAHEKERAETARLRQHLEQQLGRERATWAALSQYSDDVQRRRRVLEFELRETADPRIAEFMSWCLDERTRTGSRISVWSIPGPRDALTDKRLPGAFASNAPSVYARSEALMAAFDRARALQLIAGVDVEAALAEIRASIPEAEDPRMLSASVPTSDAASLDAQDAADDRARRHAAGWMGRLEADGREASTSDAALVPFRVN